MRSSMRAIVAAAVLFLCGGLAAAEELTTVAVIDTTKIYNAFYKDTADVRDFEKAKQAYLDDVAKYQAELKKLQNDRLAASGAGNSAETLRLDQDIYNKQQYLNEYRKLKTQQLNDQQKALAQSDKFLTLLAAAIKYVAESDGYSVVLDSSTQGLRFWSPQVDITNKVLDYLRRNAR